MRKPPVIPPAIPGQGLSAAELEELAYAKSLLENPGLTARISNVLGAPIEKGFKMLPKGWSDTVNKISRTALLKALQMAVATMRGPQARRKSSERFHKLLVGASGGIGRAVGVSALAPRRPISNAVILPSIVLNS